MVKGVYQRTEKHRNKLREIAIERGFGKWMIGKKFNEKTRQKMRESAKNNTHGFQKGKRCPLSEIVKRKIGDANKISLKGHHPKTEFKKGYIFSKEIREKQIRNSLLALKNRPTSLEKKSIEIIQKNNLPYRYVGDGSFLIGYKNPDFVNINGEKICIEVANRFHHQGNWKEKRIEYFSKWGWKCIVIFEDELEDKLWFV